jgi:hypothetical protein
VWSCHIFCFHFFVEDGLFNCMELQSSFAWNQESSSRRRFETPASLRLTRGIQLDLGDRAKRCFSEDPAAAYSAVPKISETSDDVIAEAFTSLAIFVELYFTAPRGPLGVLPDRIADSSSINAVKLSSACTT